jgi:hypothetical protein
MLLDPSIAEQKYIEDCENCCNPLEVSVSFEEGDLNSFQVAGIDQ